MQLLVGKISKTDSMDKREWRGEVDGHFAIRIAYFELENILEGEISSTFKIFWSLKSIPKALTVRWRVLLDKLPSKVNLVKKGLG